jgi:hypothetical protein
MATERSGDSATTTPTAARSAGAEVARTSRSAESMTGYKITLAEARIAVNEGVAVLHSPGWSARS